MPGKKSLDGFLEGLVREVGVNEGLPFGTQGAGEVAVFVEPPEGGGGRREVWLGPSLDMAIGINIAFGILDGDD